jgi:hypothetical protein
VFWTVSPAHQHEPRGRKAPAAAVAAAPVHLPCTPDGSKLQWTTGRDGRQDPGHFTCQTGIHLAVAPAALLSPRPVQPSSAQSLPAAFPHEAPRCALSWRRKEGWPIVTAHIRHAKLAGHPIIAAEMTWPKTRCSLHRRETPHRFSASSPHSNTRCPPRLPGGQGSWAGGSRFPTSETREESQSSALTSPSIAITTTLPAEPGSASCRPSARR